MARRRFFVEAVRNERAEVSGETAEHLRRVLRVEAGQRFEIADNQSVYLAEVEGFRKDRVLFHVLERLEAEAPPVRVILLASLIKFDRFEWIVEKATELGAEAIVPVEAERSEKGLQRPRRSEWSGGGASRWRAASSRAAHGCPKSSRASASSALSRRGLPAATFWTRSAARRRWPLCCLRRRGARHPIWCACWWDPKEAGPAASATRHARMDGHPSPSAPRFCVRKPPRSPRWR